MSAISYIAIINITFLQKYLNCMVPIFFTAKCALKRIVFNIPNIIPRYLILVGSGQTDGGRLMPTSRGLQHVEDVFSCQ